MLFQRSTWAVSPVSFPTARVLLLRNHRSIRCPEVGETLTLAIAVWNGLPQPLTRPFTPITHRIGNHLSCLAAEGNPHPDFLGFFEHKRAIRSSSSSVVVAASSGSGTTKVVLKGGKLSYFFLIQVDTVVREMPKVRVRPRRLLRSWSD